MPTTNPVRSIGLAAFDGIISDDDFIGLVVVMAAWCPPCREELPDMSKLYEKFKQSGIRIMALSVDAEGPEAVQPLVDKLQIPFPVYWAGTPAIEHYQVSGIPFLMVYKNGKLMQRLPGRHPRESIEKIIESLQP